MKTLPDLKSKTLPKIAGTLLLILIVVLLAQEGFQFGQWLKNHP